MAEPASLIRSPGGVFDPDDLGDQPEPVRRYLTHAISPGTPLARTVRLTMHGHIRIKRWLSYTAREVLTPDAGFVWDARVARVIVGGDQYVDGEGAMQWRLGGVLPFANASGPDVSRSGRGRGAGEAIWLPTALTPRLGTTWTARDDGTIVARLFADGDPIDLRLTIDEAGAVRSLVFDRWGKPEGSTHWSLQPFGGTIDAEGTFDGITVPTRGSVGWQFGTSAWPDGEFFRFTIDTLHPVTDTPDR